MNDKVYITECPRDAMQGLAKFIPTSAKIAYLNALLNVGFDVLDFGSFVSPKAIPQMADTAEIARSIIPGNTQLLAIVANPLGARQACEFENISILGFPYSVSPTFLARNINHTPQAAWELLLVIRDEAFKHGKTPLVYLSMCFGNPYNDDWSEDLVVEAVGKLREVGIRQVALSDTIASATPAAITSLFLKMNSFFPDMLIGAHFHTRPDNWEANLSAAWAGGCRRFDGAIRGYGGCPMAKDELTGNLPTESLLAFLNERNATTSIHPHAFQHAFEMALSVFGPT